MLSVGMRGSLYDPVSNTWTKVKPMLNRRCRLGVATLNGKLYACGGYDGSSFLRSVEEYSKHGSVKRRFHLSSTRIHQLIPMTKRQVIPMAPALPKGFY